MPACIPAYACLPAPSYHLCHHHCPHHLHTPARMHATHCLHCLPPYLPPVSALPSTHTYLPSLTTSPCTPATCLHATCPTCHTAHATPCWHHTATCLPWHETKWYLCSALAAPPLGSDREQLLLPIYSFIPPPFPASWIISLVLVSFSPPSHRLIS